MAMALARVCFLAEPSRAGARTDHPRKGPTLLDRSRLTPIRIAIIILAAFGLAGAIAGPAVASPAAMLASPATASPAGAGTSVIVAATRSPDASGSAYAGEITFDHGKWCLGSLPNPKTGKPTSGSVVWWIPCQGKAGEPYFKNWIIDVIHTRAGSLAQVAAAANLDVCFSESNRDTDVSLRACTSLSDRNWISVRQIGIQNAWTLELYGRWLTSRIPLNQISKAAWSARQSSIVQFPPHEAHTATASPAGAGTSVILAATRSPDASGSAYAGEITFDHGKWCLGAAPSRTYHKPVEGSAVRWTPCSSPEYDKQWLVDVIHTRAGSLAEIKPLSNLDVCWSEGNNATVVLQPCGSLMDQTWLIVRQIGIQNAWTVELYDRYLASKKLPVTVGIAVWSPRQAFIIQFPPHEAHTEIIPAGAAVR